MSGETRFWTVLGLLVAVVSAWIGYQQWMLAAKPPGQYVRMADGATPTPMPSQTTSPTSPPVPEVQPSTPTALQANDPVVETPSFTFASPLPSKIDIFWCDGAQSGGKLEIAEKVLFGLNRRISARVRVRALPARLNSTPSYSIYDNIVRYDPGEVEAAKELARFATFETGQAFSAAPALPGSPSIDYLSVFVCR